MTLALLHVLCHGILVASEGVVGRNLNDFLYFLNDFYLFDDFLWVVITTGRECACAHHGHQGHA